MFYAPIHLPILSIFKLRNDNTCSGISQYADGSRQVQWLLRISHEAMKLYPELKLIFRDLPPLTCWFYADCPSTSIHNPDLLMSWFMNHHWYRPVVSKSCECRKYVQPLPASRSLINLFIVLIYFVDLFHFNLKAICAAAPSLPLFRRRGNPSLLWDACLGHARYCR